MMNREQQKTYTMLGIVSLVVLGLYIGLRHEFYEPKFTVMCITGPGITMTNSEIVRYNVDGPSTELYFQGDFWYPRITVVNSFCMISKNSATTVTKAPPQQPPAMVIPPQFRKQ